MKISLTLLIAASVLLASAVSHANPDNDAAEKELAQQEAKIKSESNSLIKMAEHLKDRHVDFFVLPHPDQLVSSLRASLTSFASSANDVCEAAEAISNIGGSGGRLDAQDCLIRMNRDRLKQLFALKTKLQCNTKNCQDPSVERRMDEAFYTYRQP